MLLNITFWYLYITNTFDQGVATRVIVMNVFLSYTSPGTFWINTANLQSVRFLPHGRIREVFYGQCVFVSLFVTARTNTAWRYCGYTPLTKPSMERDNLVKY